METCERCGRGHDENGTCELRKPDAARVGPAPSSRPASDVEFSIVAPTRGALEPSSVSATSGTPDGQLLGGRYRLEKKIGAGGMSEVFQAEYVALRKKVAVKRVSAALARNESAVKRFVAEAPNTARLRHRNIVDVTDFGVDDEGRPYVVMELLDGPRLSDVRRKGPLPVARALHIVEQILDALEVVHEVVVHRDLKPSNVMLVQAAADPDFVKILDFGIAKAIDGEDLTEEGVAIGTPAYMAPETIGGSAGSTHPRVDVYAVGVILYELLSGRPAWGSRTGKEMLFAKQSGVPLPSLADVVPECPPWLVDVVARGTAPDPTVRFQTARELRQALRGDGELDVRTLTAGTVVDEIYRVERTLGEGGMGVVYLAWDTRLERHCALKFLCDAGGEADEVARERFLRDGKLAGAVDHPNVVRVFASRSWSGHPFLAMEYVCGRTLREYWRASGWKDLVRIVGDVADALGAIHAKGIIHRDLSPENILIEDESGRVKVVDFGVAHVEGSELTRPSQGNVIGRLGYMAPEQARPGEPLTPASDQWALAAIVYEALAGFVPLHESADADSFTQSAQIRLADRLQSGERPRPLRDLAREVPAGVDAALTRALAPVPAERFPTLREFVAALSSSAGAAEVPLAVTVLASSEEEAPQSASVRLAWSTTTSGAARRRRVAPRVAVAVAIIAGLAMIGVVARPYFRRVGDGRDTEATLAASAADRDGSSDGVDAVPRATVAVDAREATTVALRVVSEPAAVLLLGQRRFLLPTVLERVEGTREAARVEKKGFEPKDVELVFEPGHEDLVVELEREAGHGKKPHAESSSSPAPASDLAGARREGSRGPLIMKPGDSTEGARRTVTPSP